MINSKAKGNRFELKVAKLLTVRFGVDFSRVPCSGGLHWQGDSRVSGDIVPPVDWFWPYSLECKDRSFELSIPQLMAGKGPLSDWYEQANKDAMRAGDGYAPVVVFNVARRGIYALIDESQINTYRPINSIVLPNDLVILDFDYWMDDAAAVAGPKSVVTDTVNIWHW